jgi:hypothetical protein
MVVEGYHGAVKEFQLVLKLEDKERKDNKHKYKIGENKLLQDKDKVKRILDVLSMCQEYHDAGKDVQAPGARIDIRDGQFANS